jgi:hypothetical protein
MLIDTREKKNFVALKPMITRDHIGQHLLVGMTDMRRRISVVDCRGNEECLRHTVKLPDESL